LLTTRNVTFKLAEDALSDAEHVLTQSTAGFIHNLLFPYREIAWDEAVQKVGGAPADWLLSQTTQAGLLLDPRTNLSIGRTQAGIPFYLNTFTHEVTLQVPAQPKPQ